MSSVRSFEDDDAALLAAPAFRAVAVDFDGTLTDAGRPEPEVLEAIRATRHRGVRVVLVTGRILTELRAVFPDVYDYFDAVVAENGAVVSMPPRLHHLATSVPPELGAALAARGVAARQGDVLVACSGRDEHIVLEEVHRLGLECELINNRAELMVLPAGVTKGAGLVDALARLGLSRHSTIAIGDAENDHSLLDVAELAVAPANAVPSLKRHADVLLDEPDGAGVAAFLLGVDAALRGLPQRSRRKIVLGTDEHDAPAELPAAQVNVLIAGGTGDGKSYVAGLMAEELIGMGYSVLIIDPEGDHVGLGQLHDVLVIGGDRHLPPPEAVVSLLRHPYASVVIDLSHLDADGQARYLAGLPAEIEAHRRATGLPHWVLVDEAHRALGPTSAALTVFDPAAKGHCLISWRPAELSPDALASIDIVLALTNPHPDSALVDIAAAVADLPRGAMAARLSTTAGRIVTADRGYPQRVVTVRPSTRSTVHLRHEHKYAKSGVEPARRFYFRSTPDELSGSTAGNLRDLETELARCTGATLRHHCPRHDFSRWIAEVFHDEKLADAIHHDETAVTEDSPAALVEAARLRLVADLQERLPRAGRRT